jgi:hypothetical protein
LRRGFLKELKNWRLGGVLSSKGPAGFRIRDPPEALAREDFGAISLGTPEPRLNAPVTYLVAQGSEAVPYLVEALASTNEVQAGYAAFCLSKIGTPAGREEARIRLRSLRQNPKGQNYRSLFAINYLTDYLAGTEPPQDDARQHPFPRS